MRRGEAMDEDTTHGGTGVGQTPRARHVAPLYAAGFVTAFGAHSIAANLGGYARGEHASLLTLGVLLAEYDGAEVVLKPVFGALADRVGPRPVLLGGLAAFAVCSAAFALAGNPALVGSVRLGQGAAARRRSPRPPARWSRGWPPRRATAGRSAAMACGRASATPAGRWWAGYW